MAVPVPMMPVITGTDSDSEFGKNGNFKLKQLPIENLNSSRGRLGTDRVHLLYLGDGHWQIDVGSPVLVKHEHQHTHNNYVVYMFQRKHGIVSMDSSCSRHAAAMFYD